MVEISINPFFPNAPFLYPLKISENFTVFWPYQEVEKGCIVSKWVNASEITLVAKMEKLLQELSFHFQNVVYEWFTSFWNLIDFQRMQNNSKLYKKMPEWCVCLEIWLSVWTWCGKKLWLFFSQIFSVLNCINFLNFAIHWDRGRFLIVQITVVVTLV